MLPKSVLFYWSKGAETRRKMLRIINTREEKGEPSFLNVIASELGITHAAAKKHLDLLVEEGYIEQINPGGKPVYLRLTEKGKEMIEEFLREG